jgi:hypothetical protein
MTGKKKTERHEKRAIRMILERVLHEKRGWASARRS